MLVIIIVYLIVFSLINVALKIVLILSNKIGECDLLFLLLDGIIVCLYFTT